MSEPTAVDRVLMVLKTVASIATWVGALGIGFIRGKLRTASRES